MINRLAWVFAVALTTVACATNPVTGSRELALVSESQEIALGQQSAAAAVAQLGLVDDPALQEYVQRLGKTLAAASERPDLPWAFGVVDDPTPNAFAAPGGFIFITRGMLALMRSEAELAGVLGHEIGHVTARHSVAMISRSQLAQLGLGIGAMISPTIASLGELAGTGLQLLFLRYSRDAELQADDLGYRYALGQGYNVAEMSNMFVSLQRVGEASERSKVPAWLSTHPYPEDRVRRIQARVAAEPLPTGLRSGVDEYMEHIDGLVYGENPRNGYFREQLFLHPDLGFQVNFPRGWQTRNMAQAVLAGSERQDALLQLTLADGNIHDAAAKFFSQQGIEATRVSEEHINGLPAVTGYFSAQTEQGLLAGVAAFVSLDQHTYALVGYTPAQVFSSYEPVLRSAVRSFSRLTDPQVLAAQPQRLEIIRSSERMSLTAFASRYPSTVDLNELALLNQLDDSGTPVPAGYPFKRVVGPPAP
ncbi:MAG: M48 family metalloprotease [Gammaproteobacteria bacterium]